MTTQHRYREHWINVQQVAKVEHGTRPHTLIFTFDNPAAQHECLEAMCTGLAIASGGVRHDTGKHCPVHPDHDD